MTLPDKVLLHVHRQGGEVNDEECRVAATIAVAIGLRDVAAVHDALQALAQSGMVIRSKGLQSGRTVTLTEKGVRAANRLLDEPPAPAPAEPSPSSNGYRKVSFVQVTVDEVLALPKFGARPSIGERILREFLASELDAVRLTDLPKPAPALTTSLQGAVKKLGLREQVLVRNSDGEVYIAKIQATDKKARGAL